MTIAIRTGGCWLRSGWQRGVRLAGTAIAERPATHSCDDEAAPVVTGETGQPQHDTATPGYRTRSCASGRPVPGAGRLRGPGEAGGERTERRADHEDQAPPSRWRASRRGWRPPLRPARPARRAGLANQQLDPAPLRDPGDDREPRRSRGSASRVARSSSPRAAGAARATSPRWSRPPARGRSGSGASRRPVSEVDGRQRGQGANGTATTSSSPATAAVQGKRPRQPPRRPGGRSRRRRRRRSARGRRRRRRSSAREAEGQRGRARARLAAPSDQGGAGADRHQRRGDRLELVADPVEADAGGGIRAHQRELGQAGARDHVDRVAAHATPRRRSPAPRSAGSQAQGRRAPARAAPTPTMSRSASSLGWNAGAISIRDGRQEGEGRRPAAGTWPAGPGA